MARCAERIDDAMAVAAEPDDAAGVEALQIEGAHVELARHFRVGGQQHLEAAVEAEAVDDVSAHPTAHPVRRFDDDDVPACLMKHTSRGQAGETGADDHHFGPLGQIDAAAHVDAGASNERNASLSVG